MLEEVTEGEGEAGAGVADSCAEDDGESCPLVVEEPPPGARAADAVAKAVGTPELEGAFVAAPDALLPAMLGVPAPAVPLGGALTEGGAEVTPVPVCEAAPLSVGATLPVLRDVPVPLLSALPVALPLSVAVALPPALPVAPPLKLCSSDALAAGVADTGALGEPGSGEPLELPLAQGRALCVPVEERLTGGEEDAEPHAELLVERSGLLEMEGQAEGLLELGGVALTPRDAVPARTDAVPDGDATQEPAPLKLEAADELVRRLGVEAAEAAVPPPLAVAETQPEEVAASEGDAALDLLNAEESVASGDDETEGDSVLAKEEEIAAVVVCESLPRAEWEGGELRVEVPLTDGEGEALFEGVALWLSGRDAEIKPVAVGARLRSGLREPVPLPIAGDIVGATEGDALEDPETLTTAVEEAALVKEAASEKVPPCVGLLCELGVTIAAEPLAKVDAEGNNDKDAAPTEGVAIALLLPPTPAEDEGGVLAEGAAAVHEGTATEGEAEPQRVLLGDCEGVAGGEALAVAIAVELSHANALPEDFDEGVGSTGEGLLVVVCETAAEEERDGGASEAELHGVLLAVVALLAVAATDSVGGTDPLVAVVAVGVALADAEGVEEEDGGVDTDGLRESSGVLLRPALADPSTEAVEDGVSTLTEGVSPREPEDRIEGVVKAVAVNAEEAVCAPVNETDTDGVTVSVTAALSEY